MAVDSAGKGRLKVPWGPRSGPPHRCRITGETCTMRPPRPVEDAIRFGPLFARRSLVIGTAALAVAVLTGTATGLAAAHVAPTAHPRRVAPPAAATGPARGTASAPNASKADASSPGEFTTTANPVTLDPPVRVPPTKPVVVTIADNAAFGNAPPAVTSTVAAAAGPVGRGGARRDRHRVGPPVRPAAATIYDGATQIFLGVTPEPTPAGITWHVQKDITGYLPILQRHPDVLHLRGQLPVQHRHRYPDDHREAAVLPGGGRVRAGAHRRAWPRPRWPATPSTRRARHRQPRARACRPGRAGGARGRQATTSTRSTPGRRCRPR